MFQKRVYSKICDSKELFGYGSRTIALEEDCPPPPPNSKINPKPNPHQGEIFLGGNCPDNFGNIGTRK